MKTTSTLLSLILFLFSNLSAQSNHGSIKGRVTDPEGLAAPYANVLLVSAADSTKLVKAGLTDNNGGFELTPVVAGEYRLRVTLLGMENYFSLPFSLADQQVMEYPDIRLVQKATEVEEVKIIAEKPTLTVKPDMIVFNVDGTPNAIGNNALELLRKSPGVVVDNNENIMLLGKTGVRIYIDGKPSPLSATDLAGLLKSMQSTEIESIEIITNPSSRFDAEGNAGIINIKMKKDLSLGFNGNVTLGYAIGKYSKYNGSLAMNYRSKKINAFGSFAGNMGKSWNFMDFYRVQSGSYFDQSTEMVHDNKSQNFRIGADYYINKKNTIGVLATGFGMTSNSSTEASTYIGLANTEGVQSVLVSNTTNDATRQNYNANLNFRHDGGNGTILNVDADYGIYLNNTDSYQPNTYFDSTQTNVLLERNFSSYAPSTIQIRTLKTDYEHGLWGGKLGLGGKVSSVITDNTFDFYNVVNGVEELDTNRSNTFIYTENVNAAYANYQKQIKKWGIQAGVRVEQTNSLGELQSNDSIPAVERHYLNLFPSGGITYAPSRVHSFQLTYSRRIDRPRYDQLNPFEFKLDELTYRRGNPFLRPQYTHNIQLSHTYKYTLNTTLSYAITSDFFTEFTDTTEVNRSYLTTMNLSTRKVATLSVSYPFSPFKWWSIFTSASVFNVRNQADFGVGKEIDLGVTSYNVYHQQSFNLPKDFSLQLSGFYNSPNIWGANFRNSKFWGVEAGLSKKFLEGRGNLKLAVSDIFLGMRWSGTQTFGGLYMEGRGGWESRQFRVNFTYLFGNQQAKGGSRRKTGLEDEGNRAGGGGGMR